MCLTDEALYEALARTRDEEPSVRLVCSWCDGVIREGLPGGIVSHGMCGECFTRVERQIDRIDGIDPTRPDALEITARAS